MVSCAKYSNVHPSSYPGVCRVVLLVLLALAVSFAGASLLAVDRAEAKATVPAKVKIASVKSPDAEEVSVSVKKAKGAKGYQYVASTSKKFDSSGRYVIAGAHVKKTSATLEVPEGGTWYVRVRAYSKKGVYGKWSSIKVVSVLDIDDIEDDEDEEDEGESEESEEA